MFMTCGFYTPTTEVLLMEYQPDYDEQLNLNKTLASCKYSGSTHQK